MKVYSTSGAFDIVIKVASIEKNFIVINAQMGVWDSNVYLSPEDFRILFSFLLRPSFILYLLKLSFLLILGRKMKNNAK